MRITLMSIIVQDQQKAIDFYEDVLGFVKKQDIPAGEYRWLTLAAPEEPDGTCISLEPDAMDFARTYQRALYDAGIPCTAFAVANVQAEYQRLLARGVRFKGEPRTPDGAPTMATFDDTCGNWIQIYEG